MSQPIIQIENIGKAYRLGQADVKHAMFRDVLRNIVKAPLRRFKELRGFREGEDLFWALRNVSFDVQQGEVVGIIGRNGAGKSTLLKILSRITEPTEGKAILRGRVASLLEVGTGFHPELTGRENVYLNGAILGMSRAEITRKFDEIVAFAEIEKFLDTPVKRYSSGMYVRLAFAVAAHLEPEILIVDEVLAVGDAEFQKKCLGKMSDVTKEGRTILFVSHNMAAVKEICSRAILLKNGRTVHDGTPGDTLATYLGSRSDASLVCTYVNKHSNTGDCWLETAALLNAQRVPSSDLGFGEPFAVRMTWRLRHNIDAISYSVQLFDSLDRLVFVTNTLEVSDFRVGLNGGDSLEVVLDPNILVPGRYRISLSAWIRPYGMLFREDDCLFFQIHDSAHHPRRQFRAKGSPLCSAVTAWSQVVNQQLADPGGSDTAVVSPLRADRS